MIRCPDLVKKKSKKELDGRGDMDHYNKWIEKIMRNQKPYNVSDTFGGAFGSMREKWEEKRARGERREGRHYNAKLIGSAFRPHDSAGREGAEQEVETEGDERPSKIV